MFGFFEKRRMQKRMKQLIDQLQIAYNTVPYDLDATRELGRKMQDLKAEMERKGYLDGRKTVN